MKLSNYHKEKSIRKNDSIANILNRKSFSSRKNQSINKKSSVKKIDIFNKSTNNMNNNEQISPTKKTSNNFFTIKTTNQEHLINKVIKYREEICKNCQFYQLLYTNVFPLKCLIHNNILSLYCENQQKQICVNCVYSSNEHKLHRISPIKNSLEQISSNNFVMRKKFEKQLKQIYQLHENSVRTIQNMNQICSQLIEDLSIQFEKISSVLSDKFQQLRLHILKNFNQILIVNQELSKQSYLLQRIFEEKVRIFEKQQNNQTKQLFVHANLTTLLQLEGVNYHSLKKINKQTIKTQMIGQIYKIRQLIEKLKIFKKYI